MKPRDPFDLMLPTRAVANSTFAFDQKLAEARRFMAEHGIHEVRPVYGRTLRKARSAAANVSRFDPRPAANDAATRQAIEETAA